MPSLGLRLRAAGGGGAKMFNIFVGFFVRHTFERQDTYLQVKTNRKSYVAYRMAPLRVTFSDLVTFAF